MFSYLAEGVPLASVFDGELRDLINKHQFGFNFFSVEELTLGVLRLYENRELIEKMAERARSFFNEHCDAASIYRNYADWVERLAKDSHEYNSKLTQLKK